MMLYLLLQAMLIIAMPCYDRWTSNKTLRDITKEIAVEVRRESMLFDDFDDDDFEKSLVKPSHSDLKGSRPPPNTRPPPKNAVDRIPAYNSELIPGQHEPIPPNRSTPAQQQQQQLRPPQKKPPRPPQPQPGSPGGSPKRRPQGRK